MKVNHYCKMRGGNTPLFFYADGLHFGRHYSIQSVDKILFFLKKYLTNI